MCVFVFRGVSGGIVVLSSLSSFVARTRLIRSEISAIHSPDQSRQGIEQYNILSEVLERSLGRLFDGLSSKSAHIWDFQVNLLTISFTRGN